MSYQGDLVTAYVSTTPTAEEEARANQELDRKDTALERPRARLAALKRISRRLHGALNEVSDIRSREMQSLQARKNEIEILKRKPAQYAYKPSQQTLREIAGQERFCNELDNEYNQLSSEWHAAKGLETACAEWLDENEAVFFHQDFAEVAR